MQDSFSKPWELTTYEQWKYYNHEVCEIEPNNMIPIKAAIVKMRETRLGDRWLGSDAIIRMDLIEYYSDALNIERRGQKYYCSKDRLDLIDFVRYHATVRLNIQIWRNLERIAELTAAAEAEQQAQ